MKSELLKILNLHNADFILLNSLNEFSRFHDKNTELAEITRFLGTEGEALIDKFGKIYLFVDPRYHITAENLAGKDLEPVKLQMGEGFLDGFKKIVSKNAKILVPDNISHIKFLKYNEYFENIEIIESRKIHINKDIEVYSIAEDIEITKKRIELINSKYVLPYLITNLDEIAYTLELRALEFEFSTSFSSKMILDNIPILFSNFKIPENYKFIKVLPLSEFENYIKNYKDKILYDEESINQKTFSLLKNPVKDEKKIIKNLMAKKSKQEINHLKYAFSKLDEALFGFRAKIKKDMNEIELKNLFEEELYVSGAIAPSFKTLLAVGENSASIHYSDYGEKTVSNSGDIILLDCGGYWDLGLATDITRVFAPFGATYKQKKVYTIVLKSFIKAYNSNSISPCELDKIARNYLAKNAPDGFEFSHALGHGVGQSVHQNPPTLSPRTPENSEIKPNMVFTIEPGLYKQGEFGIRLENTCYLNEKHEKISLSHFPFEKNLINYDMLDDNEKQFLDDWGVND